MITDNSEKHHGFLGLCDKSFQLKRDCVRCCYCLPVSSYLPLWTQSYFFNLLLRLEILLLPVNVLTLISFVEADPLIDKVVRNNL